MIHLIRAQDDLPVEALCRDQAADVFTTTPDKATCRACVDAFTPWARHVYERPRPTREPRPPSRPAPRS